MSHATVLVALSPADMKKAGGDLERAIDFQMEPFNEQGKWFGDGSRWDWWVIGGRYAGRLLGKDALARSELTEEGMRAHARASAESIWDEWKAAEHNPPRDWYGIEEGEDREAFAARLERRRVKAHAFLRSRRWSEGERMGWFAMSTATECEIADPEYEGKCIFENPEAGSKIIGWNEPGEVWLERFFDRFVRDLPAETMLVMVDYHV